MLKYNVIVQKIGKNREIKLEKIKKICSNNYWEIAYLAIYSLIFFHHFLNTTMFKINWPAKIGLVFYFVIMIYTCMKFLFHNKMNLYEKVFAGIIVLCFVTSAYFSDYSFLFEIAFLIVGAKDVSFDKILRIYCVIGTIIMAIAFIASQLGIIENLVYVSEKGNRNSFGIIYPTDFAAHLFYLLAALICISNVNMKMIYFVLASVATVIVYKGCAAYTSTICFILLIVGMILIRFFFQKDGKRDYLLRVLSLSPLFMSLMFMILAHLFSDSDTTLVKINELLSNRLALSSKGIEEYGYSLFGQWVTEIGNGGTTVYDWGYFFLDDSYIRIALEYGLVVLSLVLVMWIVVGNRAINHERKVMLLVLVVLSIHCFMEHHWLEIAYNPFILGVFADMEVRRKHV